ncbi:hypothetical protein [Loktanella sp. R86503]|uniref:hypothetical protein n=1 Tax=Loktanella sp. R86503 TaxID=3093847 RepID=UPI0036DA9566
MSLERFLINFCSNLSPYAVMRNYDSLPQSANGSDIDIFLGEGDEASCDVALRNALAYVGGFILGDARTTGFRKIVVMGRDNDKGGAWWGIRLDLSFGFRFLGSVRLVSDDDLLNVAIKHNDISVLPPNWADLMGLLKHVLNHEDLPQRYLTGAIQLIQGNKEELESVFAPMDKSTYERFLQLCLQGATLSPAVAVCEIRTLRRLILRHGLYDNPLHYILGRIGFFGSKLNRIFHSPGIVVSVLGTDGAGKSTIIEAIRPVLEEATHTSLQVRHLRPNFLPPLSRLKLGDSSPNIGPVTDPHASRPSGRVGSIVRLLWLWADYILGYWLIVRPRISRAPVVFIFDRYADDLALDPHRFRLGVFKGLARRVPLLVPRPDVTIALYAEPEAIHARKPELPLEEVARQIEELKAWAEKRPEAVLVSTSGSIEAARDAVLSAIVTTAARRS